MTTFGLTYDSLKPTPAEGMRMIANMGVTHIRWPVYLVNDGRPGVMVAPGRYDFSFPDQALNAMSKAGLIPAINPGWLPRWATGGVPINEPYAATIRRPPGGALWLSPPFPAFDPQIMFDAGVQFAGRYGSTVPIVSCWNEAGILDFYPQKDGYPSYLSAMRKLYDGVIIPFVRGWRSVCPGVLFLGPDAESPGTLNLFLWLEQESQAANISAPSPIDYDIVSYHVYPARIGDSYAPDTLKRSLAEINRVGGFLDVMSRYPSHDNTEQWATEFADGGDCTAAEWSAAILRTARRITGLFPFQPWQFFADGQRGWEEENKFVPNDAYREYEQLITHGPTYVTRWARNRAVSK